MRWGLTIAALVLELDLTGVVLMADVAGRIVGAPTGEGGGGGTDDERARDHGGGNETANRHVNPSGELYRPFIGRHRSRATSVDGPRTFPRQAAFSGGPPCRDRNELMFDSTMRDSEG